MSAAPFQDPSGSTAAINSENLLSNGEEAYSPSVVLPLQKSTHTRQSSAPKRKRAQSGMDNVGNVIDVAPFDFGGQDKPKRQKLDVKATSERMTGFMHPVNQIEHPRQQFAAGGTQFNDSYVSAWANPPLASETFVPKEEQIESSAQSAVPQDAKATPESSEHSFPRTPNFQKVLIGNKLVKPWYFSPYPTGDIAAHAYTLNTQPLNGGYHPVAGLAKGHAKVGKIPGMINPQPLSSNGFVGYGPGPSRSHTRHDFPAHANSDCLFVCKRCFAYADRPIPPLHQEDCLLQIPGEVVYDNHTSQSEQNSIETMEGPPNAILSHQNGVLVNQGPEKAGRVRIYEVDPMYSPAYKIFCKNVTLFGKFFIESKSIVFDCATFLYYLITVVENGIETVAGFFTKEKESAEEYNLACIIVFPPYQKRRLGRLLIQFSYELSKYDGRIGSPEKPLSDLGVRSYAPIWMAMVLDYLHEQIAIPLEMQLDRPKGNAKRQQIPLGTSRILKSKGLTASGSATETNLMFSCTLEQIAAGAYLTTSDASFALAELGLGQYIAGFAQKDSMDERRTQDGRASQVASSSSEPPFDPLTQSTREPSTKPMKPVPILTRDFVQLLGEKAKARKEPINKEFVLL